MSIDPVFPNPQPYPTPLPKPPEPPRPTPPQMPLPPAQEDALLLMSVARQDLSISLHFGSSVDVNQAIAKLNQEIDTFPSATPAQEKLLEEIKSSLNAINNPPSQNQEVMDKIGDALCQIGQT